MPVIGSVREIWRYPVKSMAGERLQAGWFGPAGLPGDRAWAVRDEAAGEVRGAKKLPALMTCAARYPEDPAEGPAPVAEITLPDGRVLRSDAPSVSAELSGLLGRSVTLWPLRPSSDLDHYRRAAPDDPDMMAELRGIFGRLEDEPIPDLSVFPPEVMEFTSPPGTYFDAFPVHFLTTATLAALEARTAGSRFDVRRFRPNLVIDSAAAQALAEPAWTGRALRIGGAVLSVAAPCPRCVMTTLPQRDLPKDPAVLRTIVREAAQNVGGYALASTPGEIRVGDPVELVDPG